MKTIESLSLELLSFKVKIGKHVDTFVGHCRYYNRNLPKIDYRYISYAHFLKINLIQLYGVS